MKTSNMTLYLYAETPLHVGTGTGLGAVDMPIQREKHTNYPMIQASGVKGALRDTAEIAFGLHSKDKDTREEAEAKVTSIFGGATGSDDQTHAGAISPSDARILCFPVRALNGVFLWVTSPAVLQRFELDTKTSIGADSLPDFPEGDERDDPNATLAYVASSSRLMDGYIMLEEFTYRAEQNDTVRGIAEQLAGQIFTAEADASWRKRFISHFIVLPDDEFRDFVRYSTEVTTRIHLDDTTKIVKDGQLFTQELLPADSLLYSVLRVTDSRDDKHDVQAVIKTVKDSVGHNIQIGADETVGRGRMRLSWQEGN